jgi:hypothetical protein
MSMTTDPYLLDNYPVLHDVVMPVCRQGFGNSNCSMPMCDCREMPIEFAGPEPKEVDDEYSLDTCWIIVFTAFALALALFGSSIYAGISEFFK